MVLEMLETKTSSNFN